MRIVELELERYRQKGFYLIPAAIMAYCILVLPHKYGRDLWQKYADPLVEANRELFYIGSLTFIHTFSMVFNFVIYLPFYIFSKTRWVHQFRANYVKKWPWELPDWKEQLKKTAITIFLAHFVISPGLLYLDTKMGIKFRLESSTYPELSEVLGQLLLATFMEDFFFYWSHYILHTPKLYKLIHKKHHEYITPFTVAAEYSDVPEYLFGNLFPSVIAFKILQGRAHLFTMVFWVFWRMLTTSEAHSGFEFPWTPHRIFPMTSGGLYHNYHHSNNDGAYGSYFTFWDHLMKTNDSYYKYRSKYYLEQSKLKQA